LHDFAEIAEIKKRLRQKILARRAELSPDVHRDFSKKISDNVLILPDVKTGIKIALYWPIKDEVDCRWLLAELTDRAIIVALPTIAGKEQPLVFRQFGGEENLLAAGFGTKEPVYIMPIVEPEVIFLPLAGFDKIGARLGYGKGFYDRTIAIMKKRPRLIGLAFGIQQLEYIPTFAHDQKLDGVITENGMLWFNEPV